MTRALVLLVGLALSWALPAAAAPAKPGHVFIIVLENEGFHITFGPDSPAKFLNGLVKQGAILTNYYGTGHYSLDNYLSMISGQAPNPDTQSDCQMFSEFNQTGTAADGQAVGRGCVYPKGVFTLANQLEDKHLTWKGYMEDMGNDPSRGVQKTCGHPALGAKDGTQKAVVGDQYATRHNPFMYFHEIIDKPSCDTNVVGLAALTADLQSIETTPNFAFITPNLCSDGHDHTKGKCADGVTPGGLLAADPFLAKVVPQILASPAFKKDGLLIITFDEADIDTKRDPATNNVVVEEGDVTACCDEQPGPNIPPGSLVFGSIPDKGPGVFGPGGGRIGAVLVSPFIKPGTVAETHYNHYSLLRSLEDIFGLDHLGYAGQKGLTAFGADVFNK